MFCPKKTVKRSRTVQTIYYFPVLKNSLSFRLKCAKPFRNTTCHTPEAWNNVTPSIINSVANGWSLWRVWFGKGSDSPEHVHIYHSLFCRFTKNKMSHSSKCYFLNLSYTTPWVLVLLIILRFLITCLTITMTTGISVDLFVWHGCVYVCGGFYILKCSKRRRWLFVCYCIKWPPHGSDGGGLRSRISYHPPISVQAWPYPLGKDRAKLTLHQISTSVFHLDPNEPLSLIPVTRSVLSPKPSQSL